MKLLVITVFDQKTEAYLPPFYTRALGEAIRMFDTAVNTSGHQFAQHPEDYTLFHIGYYDDATGLLIAQSTPVSLGKGNEFVRQIELPLFEPKIVAGE